VAKRSICEISGGGGRPHDLGNLTYFSTSRLPPSGSVQNRNVNSGSTASLAWHSESVYFCQHAERGDCIYLKREESTPDMLQHLVDTDAALPFPIEYLMTDPAMLGNKSVSQSSRHSIEAPMTHLGDIWVQNRSDEPCRRST